MQDLGNGNLMLTGTGTDWSMVSITVICFTTRPPLANRTTMATSLPNLLFFHLYIQYTTYISFQGVGDGASFSDKKKLGRLY
jgi:hypothetical protein